MHSTSGQAIFNFLYVKDKPEPADLIIGFGHFDMKIPDTCTMHYQRGLAPRILFTGGIGAGSADLIMPEAKAFLERTRKSGPFIPEEAVFLEDKSTNTSENIVFSEKVLANAKPPLHFGKEIKRIILVANAYRQLRVMLTMKKHFPDVKLINCPPETTYEKQKLMYQLKFQNFDDLLIGEVDRIKNYPDKGWIDKIDIPPIILDIINREKKLDF